MPFIYKNVFVLYYLSFDSSRIIVDDIYFENVYPKGLITAFYSLGFVVKELLEEDSDSDSDSDSDILLCDYQIDLGNCKTYSC